MKEGEPNPNIEPYYVTWCETCDFIYFFNGGQMIHKVTAEAVASRHATANPTHSVRTSRLEIPI